MVAWLIVGRRAQQGLPAFTNENSHGPKGTVAARIKP